MLVLQFLDQHPIVDDAQESRLAKFAGHADHPVGIGGEPRMLLVAQLVGGLEQATGVIIVGAKRAQLLVKRALLSVEERLRASRARCGSAWRWPPFEFSGISCDTEPIARRSAN